MESKSVTAIEWLVEQIMKHDKSFLEFYGAEIEQAKEMEKQQIIDAHISGYDSSGGSAKDYYNETFNAAK
jgi:hypothetical protein